MASAWFVLLSMALAATAQYYPQPQPQAYYPYPPPQQQPSRTDYARAIGNVQRPYPPTYYPQQGVYPAITVGQQRPEGLQEVAVAPGFGFNFDTDVVGSIFQQGVSEQHRYLTPPTLKFKIGVVSDFSKKGTNRDEDTGNFKAYLFEGFLQIQKNKDHPETPNITLEFDEEKDLYKLESGINYGNKGFELATLNVFNGKLYACDDQTGVVYEIKRINEEDAAEKDDEDYVAPADGPPSDKTVSNHENDENKEKKARYVAQPWLILANEGQNKGFSCEWGVVKDGKLWIGSTGSLVPKEAKDDNSTEVSKERQFVKVIDAQGQVETLDWSTNYEKIAEAYEVNLTQGHVVHEAAAWSDALNKWVFIPRRLTKEKRDDSTWNKISTNEGVLADDRFVNIKDQKFGNLTETVGVVGLRFIPGTLDQFLLVLKAGEDTEGQVYSTLSVVDLQGKEVLAETRIGESTFYSAVEFL